MSFFFRHHPYVEYDLRKTGIVEIVQNPLVRFKLKSVLKSKSMLYYTHVVRDQERADIIAHKYYGDDTLEWVIYLVNDIIDTQFDWPLNQHDLDSYIRSKYGSTSVARATVHHYEQILQAHSVLYDGTIIPERKIEVDETTFNSLAAANRREVDSYTYELEKNEAKRIIKILHRDCVAGFVAEAEGILR